MDVREIKEVRPGKSSRDFLKWSEDEQVGIFICQTLVLVVWTVMHILFVKIV